MTTQEKTVDFVGMEHDTGRNIYLEPEERALIRTDDIYQTELDSGVEGYSKTLLAIVASCTNGGKPEGYNVQAMVGRSKRGEVAARMFAVVDDSSTDPVFERVGFQVRGCAAMVACASVACSMIEGKPFSAALRITPEDIERAVDGLAPARRYTALFAAECVRALVGDWMYRCGMGIEQMDEYLGCDEGGVACLMCEHCSLRDSRVDLRVAAALAAADEGDEDAEDGVADDEPAAPAAAAGVTGAAAAAGAAGENEPGDGEPSAPNDEEAARELAENNAIAWAFDEVRRASAASELATPAVWEREDIVPEHLSAEGFTQLVLGYLSRWSTEHAEDVAREKQEREEKKRSVRSASGCVGVPPKIPNRRLAQIEAEDGAAGEPSGGSPNLPGAADKAADDDFGSPNTAGELRGSRAESGPALAAQDEVAAVADQHARDIAPTAPAADALDDDPFAGLDVPDGYRLAELDGELVLVRDETQPPKRREIDCAHIAVIEGLGATYLYDADQMTERYAHWAYLAAEDDPVVTFAECVREDSRVYPRPYRATNLGNDPFNMSADDVKAAWEKVQASEAYADIQCTRASNGDVYFFSTKYLSPAYAASLAEYASVIRPANV